MFDILRKNLLNLYYVCVLNKVRKDIYNLLYMHVKFEYFIIAYRKRLLYYTHKIQLEEHTRVSKVWNFIF